MSAIGLRCSECGERTEMKRTSTLCLKCRRPYFVEYDLHAVAAAWRSPEFDRRTKGMWRYRELLPVPEHVEVASLGETETPVLRIPALGRRLGLPHLWMKDESRLPGASFKARGMAVAVSMLKSFGVQRATLPSAGNAAGAAAIYCAAAEMELDVFVPADTPKANVVECRQHGARVHLVDGLISDCAKQATAFEAERSAFNLATLNHPYRIEGKKTMGLELWEQFGRAIGRSERLLPDVIVYPTGGGTGLIAMAKVFGELASMGGEFTPRTVSGSASPRFVVAQAKGCAPLVRAFEQGNDAAEFFENAGTAASGLRVPMTIGDKLILKAVRDAGGACVSATEVDMLEWTALGCREGIAVCPETGVALAGLANLVRDGVVQPDERVLVFNTASSLKYLEVVERLPGI
jgi:threonine synthase